MCSQSEAWYPLDHVRDQRDKCHDAIEEDETNTSRTVGMMLNYDIRKIRGNGVIKGVRDRLKGG